jgi:hypothetical protein
MRVAVANQHNTHKCGPVRALRPLPLAAPNAPVKAQPTRAPLGGNWCEQCRCERCRTVSLAGLTVFSGSGVVAGPAVTVPSATAKRLPWQGQ